MSRPRSFTLGKSNFVLNLPWVEDLIDISKKGMKLSLFFKNLPFTRFVQLAENELHKQLCPCRG